MNASPEKELHNPWDQRADFSGIAPRNVAFSLIVVFLAALAIPVAAFYESVSILILAAFFFYVVSAVRAPFAVTMLLGTAFLTVSLTESLAAGAVVLAFVVGTGALAFLLTSLHTPATALLFPAVAAVAAFAVVGSWKIALLALGFVPAALLLAVATRLGKDRTSAICFAEVGLLMLLAAVVGYFLYTQSVARGISVKEFVELLEDALLRAALEMRDERNGVFGELLGSDETMAVVREQFSDEYVGVLIRQTLRLLPAICCILCGIVAFEAQILLNGLYRSVGWKQVLTPRSMVFTMSTLAAILYFVSFLLMLIPMKNTLIPLVISNLNLILLPGFCVIGFTMLMLNFARAKGGARLVWILLLGGVLCCSGGLALPLLAMFGSNSVVLGAMQRKLMDKQNEQD